MSFSQSVPYDDISYFTVERLCHDILNKLRELDTYYLSINDKKNHDNVSLDMLIIDSIYLNVYTNETSITLSDYKKLINYQNVIKQIINEQGTYELINSTRTNIREVAANIKKQVSLID